MNERFLKHEQNLNHRNREVRINSLKELIRGVNKGRIEHVSGETDVNNHIHTMFSFSPYSPAKAIWKSFQSGLITAGIADHYTISGADEFIKAGKTAGVVTTIGVELRADFSATELNGKRINNPDQLSIGYVTIHGIPHTKFKETEEFLLPLRKHWDDRNKLMVDRLNELMNKFDIYVSYDENVVPLGMKDEGGTITERHILYALSLQILKQYKKGEEVISFLKNKLKLKIDDRVHKYLLDENNVYYEYDIVGVLKSELLSSFYVDADKECPSVDSVIDFCRRIGAISTYCYLGDVTDSVTGDKRAQRFEDEYIDLLFDVLTKAGFNAVTYALSRNTKSQIEKIRSYCNSNNLMQISGEDINTPRQSFVGEKHKTRQFFGLYDSSWALIGHEKAATEDISRAMFSKKVIRKYPDFEERLMIYRKKGMCEAYRSMCI